MADEKLDLGCNRYMWLQEGRLLFLSKPVDRQASTAHVSSLELERERRSEHSRDLFHKLRHGRVIPQWPVAGSEGVRVPSVGHGGQMGQYSGPVEGFANH